MIDFKSIITTVFTPQITVTSRSAYKPFTVSNLGSVPFVFSVVCKARFYGNCIIQILGHGIEKVNHQLVTIWVGGLPSNDVAIIGDGTL